GSRRLSGRIAVAVARHRRRRARRVLSRHVCCCSEISAFFSKNAYFQGESVALGGGNGAPRFRRRVNAKTEFKGGEGPLGGGAGGGASVVAGCLGRWRCRLSGCARGRRILAGSIGVAWMI